MFPHHKAGKLGHESALWLSIANWTVPLWGQSAPNDKIVRATKRCPNVQSPYEFGHFPREWMRPEHFSGWGRRSCRLPSTL